MKVSPSFSLGLSFLFGVLSLYLLFFLLLSLSISLFNCFSFFLSSSNASIFFSSLSISLYKVLTYNLEVKLFFSFVLVWHKSSYIMLYSSTTKQNNPKQSRDLPTLALFKHLGNSKILCCSHLSLHFLIKFIYKVEDSNLKPFMLTYLKLLLTKNFCMKHILSYFNLIFSICIVSRDLA